MLPNEAKKDAGTAGLGQPCGATSAQPKTPVSAQFNNEVVGGRHSFLRGDVNSAEQLSWGWVGMKTVQTLPRRQDGWTGVGCVDAFGATGDAQERVAQQQPAHAGGKRQRQQAQVTMA